MEERGRGGEKRRDGRVEERRWERRGRRGKEMGEEREGRDFIILFRSVCCMI